MACFSFQNPILKLKTLTREKFFRFFPKASETENLSDDITYDRLHWKSKNFPALLSLKNKTTLCQKSIFRPKTQLRIFIIFVTKSVFFGMKYHVLE